MDHLSDPTHVGLVRAAGAAPDDDLPKLVLADYLEEQNDPAHLLLRHHVAQKQEGRAFAERTWSGPRGRGAAANAAPPGSDTVDAPGGRVWFFYHADPHYAPAGRPVLARLYANGDGNWGGGFNHAAYLTPDEADEIAASVPEGHREPLQTAVSDIRAAAGPAKYARGLRRFYSRA